MNIFVKKLLTIFLSTVIYTATTLPVKFNPNAATWALSRKDLHDRQSRQLRLRNAGKSSPVGQSTKVVKTRSERKPTTAKKSVGRPRGSFGSYYDYTTEKALYDIDNPLEVEGKRNRNKPTFYSPDTKKKNR